MATSARPGRLARAVLIAAVALAAAPSLRAQSRDERASLLLIDANTRVKSVKFRMTGDDSVDDIVLRNSIGLRAPRGLGAIGSLFSWLPFVSSPALPKFEPVMVQRDKIRLTRIYEREGFPQAQVAYEVRLDSAANTVGVTFVIDQGPPLLLRDVHIATPDIGALALPEEMAASWERLNATLAGHKGSRLSKTLETRIQSDLFRWLQDQGYAFARIETSVMGDSAEADLHLAADIGPRARVGEVIVRGRTHLDEGTIRRELPFTTGDPFRGSDLAEGQREVFGLDIVKLSLVDVAPDQPRDSTADVLVQIDEGTLRTISGRLGYASQAGISADASWEHRDFMDGARTLRLDGLARTGVGRTGTGRQIQYSGSATLRQPYLGDRRVSGLLTPFVSYRDDLFDRSTRMGFDATVLWERSALQTMSLRYGFSARRVGVARGSGLFTDLFSFLRAVDSAGVNSRTNALAYRATWGHVNNLVDPRSGWVARFGATFAGPAPISTVNYGRFEASLDRFVKLGSATLVARASAGRLFPFGRSIPSGAGNELIGLLRLRDAVFTAGGTADVRGWSSDLLGPKVPDFEVERTEDTLLIRSAGRYVPLGGLARWTASVELRVPMPIFSGQHDAFVFLDGGRVWIPDDRFVPASGLGAEGADFRAAAGGGLLFTTPVGPLKIALGYKLNPSPLDLRHPRLVGDAQLAGEPLSTVPAESLRRWHLHLSIGQSF